MNLLDQYSSDGNELNSDIASDLNGQFRAINLYHCSMFKEGNQIFRDYLSIFYCPLPASLSIRNSHGSFQRQLSYTRFQHELNFFKQKWFLFMSFSVYTHTHTQDLFAGSPRSCQCLLDLSYTSFLKHSFK